MVPRPQYMKTLKKYRDIPLVKILSGIRRCGKSTLLQLLKEELLSSGVRPDHIIEARYTSMDFDDGLTAKEMYQDLKARFVDGGQHYLLLDEVQEVDGWEKAINACLEDGHADIYVTGSNSKMMSSEISTYLTGRYVSIPVYPLSFAEYLRFKADSPRSRRELLEEYLRFGGFPVLALGEYDQRTAYQIVEGIYHSVISNDITRRHHVTSYDLFERTVRFVIENIGKTFSAHSIVKFLKGEGRSLSVESIYNYLEWLEKAFVIYRCRRFDLQGKSVLKTQEKFYLVDPALKYCRLGFNPKSIASMLENLVYFELKRRGYEVYVGKNGEKEIDFVAVRRDERVYVQVCRALPQDSDREIANLLELRDHYPKFVVTLDPLAGGNVSGVRVVSMEDFLLMDEDGFYL